MTTSEKATQLPRVLELGLDYETPGVVGQGAGLQGQDVLAATGFVAGRSEGPTVVSLETS